MAYNDYFDTRFQDKLLSIMVRDKEFVFRYDDVIKPSYFTKPEAKLLAKIVTDYVYQYKELPTYIVVNNELEKRADKNTHVDFSASFDLNKDIFTKPFDDIEYIKEEAINFAQKQSLYEALVSANEIFKSGKVDDFEKIKTEIGNSLKVGVDKNDLGKFYLRDYKDRLEDRANDETTVERVGIEFSPTLNELCSGGMGPGELWVILASTNRGKSSFLLNFAYSGLIQNKKVIFYTLEMSPDKLEARLDSRFGRVPTKTIKENGPVLSSKLGQHVKSFGSSELVIKKYPRRGASINTFLSHCSLLEGYHGFKPDLIVVDYGDIMRSTMNRSEKRDEQAEIYGELFYMAQHLNIPVITGCQSNRSGHEKDTVDLTETGESFEKVQIADVVLSINETKEEHDRSKSRLYIAKNRDDRKWVEVQLTFERDSMYINENEDDLAINACSLEY